MKRKRKKEEKKRSEEKKEPPKYELGPFGVPGDSFFIIKTFEPY